MRKIYMIRHGMTAGNLEKRYVGRTDEGLCEKGITDLVEKKKSIYTDAFLQEMLQAVSKDAEGKPIVYVTPLCRTKETAEILFAGQKNQEIHMLPVDDLQEMNFGEFEYQNYEQLANHPAYQAYIDSNGEAAFPGGEKKADFIKRCVDATLHILEKDQNDIVMVVHGGTIMGVMSTIITPHQDYFAWQVKNGEGFIIDDVGENVYRLGGVLS